MLKSIWQGILAVGLLALAVFSPLHLGPDLWSDFVNRETPYEPAPHVTLLESRCNGGVCTFRFTGGKSASGRDSLKYHVFSSMRGLQAMPMKSTRDGSISIALVSQDRGRMVIDKLARDMLIQRTFMFVFLEAIFLGVGISLLLKLVRRRGVAA